MTNPKAKIRHTKIIATLGPATDKDDVLEKIIVAGVNIVRLNFSHGCHADHGKRIEKVRAIAKKLNRVVGILADLQGPKIRVRKFENDKITLKKGAEFILDADMDELGNEKVAGIDYKELPQDVVVGDTLVLDDGRIVFEVTKIDGNKIYNRVTVGGELKNNKGINRKGGGLSADALTEKDIEDMEYALSKNVDFLAISFPRSAADMEHAREKMHSFDGNADLIAKIERTEAVININEIIKASDGVMVARGDLGVEIGDAAVPGVQKTIIQLARSFNKPVITATQMMESMITNSIPTRAEISDVANAVLDYTDAVMLSAETAAGDHPVLVVESMVRACLAAEEDVQSQVSKHRMGERFHRVDEAVAMATMYTANHLKIRAIAALTESGATTLWMTRIKTAIPVFGLSRSDRSLGKMCLYRGVTPIKFDVTTCTRDEVNRKSVECLQEFHYLDDDDIVILTKGDHLGVGGGANAMKILEVGKVF